MRKVSFLSTSKPVGETVLNTALGVGDLAQTGLLYGGSKIGQALGGKEIMSNQQALANVKSVFQPWKENNRKTFARTINEDTNLPSYIKAPLGMAAEVFLDPTTYLGGGFGVPSKLAKMSEVAKGAKAIGKAVDVAKLSEDIAKWQKYSKPISALDKLAVAGLGLQGVGELSEGNITQGAIELGLGALGASGLKQQNKLYKDINAYKTGYLDRLLPEKIIDYKKTVIDTPAKTIKGSKIPLLPPPSTIIPKPPKITKVPKDKVVYRGVGGDNAFTGKGDIYGNFFATNKSRASRFGDVSPYKVKPSAKIFKMSGEGSLPKELAKYTFTKGKGTKRSRSLSSFNVDNYNKAKSKDKFVKNFLKNKGYDGIELKNRMTQTGKRETDWVVWNNKALSPMEEIVPKPKLRRHQPFKGQTETASYKPFEITTPATTKEVGVSKNVPISYFKPEDVVKAKALKSPDTMVKEFTPFNQWRKQADARIGLNPEAFKKKMFTTLKKSTVNDKAIYQDITDYVSGGGIVSDDLNVALQEAVRNNKVAGRTKAFMNKMTNLASESKKAGITPEDLSTYIYAKHDPEFIQRKLDTLAELVEKGKQVDDTEYILAEQLIKKSNDDIARLQTKLGSKFSTLEKLGQKRFDIMNNLSNESFLKGSLSAKSFKNIHGLKDSVDISKGSAYYKKLEQATNAGKRFDFPKEAIDTTKKRFEYYIPSQRFQEGPAGSLVGQKFKDSISSGDATAQSIKDITFSMKERPKADVQLMDYASRDIPLQEQANIARTFDKLFSHKTGVLADVAEEVNVAEARYLDANKVLKVLDESGVEKYYNIKNQDVADAILGIKPYEYEGFSRSLEPFVKALETMFKPVTRLQSKVYTQWSPSFLLRNPIKDTQQALLNLREILETGKRSKGTYAGDLIAGAKGVFQHHLGMDTIGAKEIDRLSKAGLFTDFYQFTDLKKMSENFNKLVAKGDIDKKGVMDVIKALTATSENATRYAVYKKAIASGASELQALNAGLEASLNFSKRGDGSLVRMMRAVYAFTNPMLLDVERGVKTVKSPEAMSRLAFYFMAPAGAIYEWNENVGGENWRDGFSQSTLNTNWIIKMPKEVGVDLKIPKPYFFNSILAIQDAADAVSSGARSADEMAENAVNVVLSNMLPFIGDRIKNNGEQFTAGNLAPTALAPIVQHLTNQNYWGGPIYPDYKGGPDAEKMWSKTQKGLWPILNEMIPGDVSPEVIKHYISSYAPVGKDGVVDVLGMIDELSQSSARGEDLTLGQKASALPVLKGFIPKQKPGTKIKSEIYNSIDSAKEGIDVSDKVKALVKELRTNKDYFAKDEYKSWLMLLNSQLKKLSLLRKMKEKH